MPTFRQNKQAVTTSVTNTFSAVFTNPIAANSIVVAVAAINNNPTFTFTFSDDKSDAQTKETTLGSSGLVTNSPIGTTTQFAAFLTPTAGAQTFTVTTSLNFSFCELVIWEFGSASGYIFDKVTTQGLNGVNQADSGATGTLSSSSDLAVSYGQSNSNYDGTTGLGSWTADCPPAGYPTTGDFGGHQLLSSNASIHGTANLGGSSTVDTQFWAITFQPTNPPPTPVKGFIVMPSGRKRDPIKRSAVVGWRRRTSGILVRAA